MQVVQRLAGRARWWHQRQGVIQPGPQIIKHRASLLLATGITFLRIQSSSLLFNPIQLLDQRQSSVSFTPFLVLALRLDCLTELASGMGHATHMRKTIHRNNSVVAIITIGLQIPREARQ